MAWPGLKLFMMKFLGHGPPFLWVWSTGKVSQLLWSDLLSLKVKGLWDPMTIWII